MTKVHIRSFIALSVTLAFSVGVNAQALYVTPTGDVGIGTDVPISSLEVTRDDGTARISVSETNVTTAPRSILELYNNGPVGFNMYDISGDTWRFAAQTVGFRISLAGSGGPEFEVNKLGGMKVGPGAATAFELTPTGNLTISGTLTQGSDVNSKRDINVVDGIQILTKLAQLPISEWSYKTDARGVRHLGPMAQDFYSTFELGNDNTRIAPGDMAGISLAAVKALQSELISLREEKDAEIAELKDMLAERIKVIEDMLQKNL